MLYIEDEGFCVCMLVLFIVVGKMVLILVVLGVGVLIGCEGLIVYVGVGLFYMLGWCFGFIDFKVVLCFILVGGVVGIVVVFNMLLVGVVFVIEELVGMFEYCFSGLLLMVVIVGGVVLLGIMGNYVYFGEVEVSLLLGYLWLVVLLIGVICGLVGGLFVCLILFSWCGLLV